MPAASRPGGLLDSRTLQQDDAAIQASLNVRANRKREKQADPAGFMPFVITAGAVLLDEAEKAVTGEWRKFIPPFGDGLLVEQDILRASQPASSPSLDCSACWGHVKDAYVRPMRRERPRCL